jgi:hypothetical protein
MAFSYRIDPTNRRALGTLWGTVRGADIANAVRAIYEDPSWQPGFDTLWDSTGITQLLLERDDLPGVVAVQREMGLRAGQGREVIVVSRSLDDVMARMYAVMMRNEAREVRVFRSLAEATQFLNNTLAVGTNPTTAPTKNT